MGFSFRSLDAQKVLELSLPEISEDPANPIVLLVRFAGHGNPGFMSAIFKAPRDAKLDADPLAALLRMREESVVIFAEHVIVGWKNVRWDGEPCEFSTEKCEQFLREVSADNEVFDRITRFARTPENFRRPLAQPPDVGKR